MGRPGPLALLLLLLACPAASATTLTHGPLVGAVTPHSAVVWVRTDGPGAVQAECRRAGTAAPTVASPVVQTRPGDDFTAHLPVTGLAPEAAYRCRVRVGGVSATDWRELTTAPLPEATRAFSFAVFTDFKRAPAPAFVTAAALKPAFVVFLGDLDHSDPGTLDAMRLMHRRLRDQSTGLGRDFLSHLAGFPFYHVWDDHDFGLNDADRTFPGRADALRAFREYFPAALPAGQDGIWHKLRYAQVEVFLLDLRSQRDPDRSPEGPGKSILGAAQRAWLLRGLRESTARWKVLASTVPFNPTAKKYDGWGAFPADRDRVMEVVRTSGAGGVVVVSGDLHSAGALDDGTNSGVPELSVPHANIPVCVASVCRCVTAHRPGRWSGGLLCGEIGPGFGHVQVSAEALTLAAVGADGTVRKSITLRAR